MKEKILPFIIGLLVGAIITTVGFLVYSKIILNNSGHMNQNGQMGNPPSMPNGEMGGPPAKPDGDNGNESSGQSDSNS